MHFSIILTIPALAGVAQWIECWPVNQGVTGSIASHGTCLGCKPDPWLGSYVRQSHIGVSFFLCFPPFPLSLKIKMNKIFLKKEKKNNPTLS